MGNRAIVLFVDDASKPRHISPAVYLHWNGGPESIYPFLDELDRRHVRGEVDYECARFIHIVCDFFDQDAAGGLSIGASNGPAEISVEALHRYDPGDNGIYIVTRHGGHRRLLEALRDATQCTDREAIRYALGCLQLRGAGEVAATDGHQLLLQSGFDFPWDEDVLIPACKTFGCRELPRESNVAIGNRDDWVTLRIGPWTLHLAIQKEGRYPKVDDVFRDAQQATAVVNLAQEEAAFLAENLKRLPCDDDGNQPVTLDLNGQFCVRAKSKAHPQAMELALRHSRLSGQPLKVVSNRRFLEQALRLGFREFRLHGADGPVLAQDEQRRYLWMTLKDSAIGPSNGAIRIESPCKEAPATVANSSTSKPRKRPMPKTNSNKNGRAKASEHGVDGFAALVEDAENLKTSLRDAISKTNELIAGLKRHRKQSKAVQSTLNSLRQLQSLGVQ